MIRFAKELNRNAVLYGGEEGWRSVDLLKQSGDADPGQPEMAGARARRRPRRHEDSLHTLEMRDKAPSTPGALAKGGVKFAFYSDGIASRRRSQRAVKRAIDAGLTPADAQSVL